MIRFQHGLSLFLAGCLATGIHAAPPPASGPATTVESVTVLDRDTLRAGIVAKWLPIITAMGHDAEAWQQEMAIEIATAAPEHLARAAGMETYQGMMSALAGLAATDDEVITRLARTAEKNGQGSDQVAALGDTAEDLVYVPLPNACRIADTQVAGGVIAAGTTRGFDVTSVGSFAGQGGNASNCDGLGAAGSFAAVLLSVRTPAPVSDGFLTLFPFLATQPANRSLDYSGGTSTTGTVLVRLDQGPEANELSVFSSAQTHVVLDAIGYFITPEATALECVEKVSSNLDVAAGAFGTISSPSCDSGYTITGGSCTMGNFDGRVVSTRTIVNGSSQTHFCAFRNEGSVSVTGIAYGRCCRTAGRP